MRASIVVTALAGLVLACGTSPKSSPTTDDGSTPRVSAPPAKDTKAIVAKVSSNPIPNCVRKPFASKAPIAEASGATWMPDETLLVVGDSGTNGAFLSLNSEDGTVLRSGTLPLDRGASDDLEGLSRIGATVFAITSSGYVREWQEHDKGFALTHKSYSVAAKGDAQSVCKSSMDSNCGPNYEGLCLLAQPSVGAPCVGFAAAKARGTLVCLTQTPEGRLRARPAHSIKVASPKTLSGCHFDTEGRLWFGNNVFAANSVGIVEGYQTPDSATITRLGPLGLGFSEAIATGTESRVYRFSDTTGSPSLLDAYVCR